MAEENTKKSTDFEPFEVIVVQPQMTTVMKENFKVTTPKVAALVTLRFELDQIVELGRLSSEIANTVARKEEGEERRRMLIWASSLMGLSLASYQALTGIDLTKRVGGREEKEIK